MNRAATISTMREKIALESPVDTPDPAGGYARSWSLVAEIFARVTPIQSREQFIAERHEFLTTHKFVIRWRPDVSAHMRFRDEDRTFAIHAVFDTDGLRRFMTCYCEEIVT